MFWAIALTLLLAAVLLAVWPLFAGPFHWKATAIAATLMLPLAGAWLYLGVGTPAALDPDARQPSAPPEGGMAEMADRLRARLTESPEDLDGWVLLGRTYKTVQRYPEAVEALETAARLVPDHPLVQVELVEARLFASNDPRITPDMVASLEQAVAAEPGLQKANWLLGVAAAQRGDDRAAITWWEVLLAQVEPGSGVAEAVAAQIAEARVRLGDSPPEPKPAATLANEFEVEVDLGSEAREQLTALPPEATLFVIVRPAGATAGPPLGVRRVERPEFPLSLALSDADSMLEQRPISSVAEVEVLARLSLTGKPMAASGDWESPPATTGSMKPARLQLNRRLP